jgi:hypothetical protein
MTQEKKIIKYPSTGQFRNVVKSVSERTTFVGLDDNGKAIYDPSIKKPVLTARGTVKLHGTNAGVSYNNAHGMWAQSKEQVITIESDNAGFAFHAHANEEFYTRSLKSFAEDNDVDLDVNTVTVYGEWAGEGIQKGMGITNHPKSLFVFGVKVSKPGDEEFKSFWINAEDFPINPDTNIYNIYDFQTFEMEIDFSRPDLAQNKMIEIMLEVERECPVAREFSHIGIGEGNVWSVEFKDEVYRFKVKGEKHAGKSKVKTLKVVDSEKLNKIHELVNKVTPAWRLDQMVTESCELNNSGHIDRAKLGDYLRMVIKDVMKEEMDLIVEAGLEPKDINKYISQVAKDYFFERERNDLGVE